MFTITTEQGKQTFRIVVLDTSNITVSILNVLLPPIPEFVWSPGNRLITSGCLLERYFVRQELGYCLIYGSRLMRCQVVVRVINCRRKAEV
jgi:hypothetical protein